MSMTPPFCAPRVPWFVTVEPVTVIVWLRLVGENRPVIDQRQRAAIPPPPPLLTIDRDPRTDRQRATIRRLEVIRGERNTHASPDWTKTTLPVPESVCVPEKFTYVLL